MTMRKEYDLRSSRPNPYATRIGALGCAELLERFLRREHFVRIDDDLVEAFPDESSVNEALRRTLEAGGVVRARRRATARATRAKKSA
jgi:hypothetical protein